MKKTKVSAKTTAAAGRKGRLLSAEEKAALRETLEERKGKGLGEDAVLAKIAEMDRPDREMAGRIHKIVRRAAPGLAPKTWYGMPAYADRDGKVVCFFQAATKFKVRYATLGFQQDAHLDEGNMWPTSYALTKLTAAEEARIEELMMKAAP